MLSLVDTLGKRDPRPTRAMARRSDPFKRGELLRPANNFDARTFTSLQDALEVVSHPKPGGWRHVRGESGREEQVRMVSNK